MSDSQLNLKVTATIGDASAQLKSLNATLSALEAATKSYGASAATALNAQIVAVKQQIAAYNDAATASRNLAAADQEATTARRALLDASLGPSLEQPIQSAAASARVLATSLSAAAEADSRLRDETIAATAALQEQRGVLAGLISQRTTLMQRGLASPTADLGKGLTLTPSAGFKQLTADLAGVKQSLLSAEESASVFKTTLGEVGAKLQLTPATGFSRVAAEFAGVKQSLLSASESAEVFKRELGEIGTGLQLTPKGSFTQLVGDLAGVKQSFISARDSAGAFESELGPVGEKLRLVSETSFNRLVGDLAGVKISLLSAEESAAVFERTLGAVGAKLQLTPTSGFSHLVSDLVGVKQSLISAEESALVFQNTLGEIGTRLTLTPATSFNRMVADLAGVKQSLLSAEESAGVFARAGLTATETTLGMTESSVAAAAATERLANSLTRTGEASGFFTREARHIVAIFDGLARGQRGQVISSLGAAARDAGIGVASLAGSLGTLVAVMATVEILRKAEEMGKWATETRAAASASGMSISAFSQIQGAMTLMGLKADSANVAMRRLAQSLSQALASDTSDVATAFHNLGISQDALQRNTEGTAGVLKLLATAFTQTADDENKVANFTKILGRSFEELYPLLQRGGDGVTELQNKAKELGTTLTDETAASLIKTGEAVTSLGVKIKGDGVSAMVAWGPTIQALAKLLGGLADAVGAVTSAIGLMVSAIPRGLEAAEGLGQRLAPDAVDAARARAGGTTAPGDFLSNQNSQMFDPITMRGKKHGEVGPQAPDTAEAAAADAMRSRLSQPEKRKVPPLPVPGEKITPIEQMRLDMTTAAADASKGGGSAQQLRARETQAEIDVIKKTLASGALDAKQYAKEKIQAESELNQKVMQLNNERASAGSAAARQSYQDFAANEKLKIAEANGDMSKIKAVYDEWLSAAEGRYKQHASVIANIEREKVQAINTARLKEIDESSKLVEQQMKLSSLDARMAALQQPGARSKQTGPTADLQQASAARAEAAQIDQMARQEVAALTEVMNTAEQGSETQRAAAQKILDVVTAAKEKEVRLYEQAASATERAAQKQAESFVKFFDSVGSQFEQFSQSLAQSLIAPQVEYIRAGLTTIKESMRGQEIRQAAQRLFTSIVSDLANTLQKALSKTIANALSGGASNTISELLGNSLSKAFSSIVGNTAGSAVGGAAGNAAGSAASSAVQSTAIVSALGTTSTAMTTALTGSILTGATTTTTAITTMAGLLSAQLDIIAINTAATAVKPEALGFSYAGGGIVPSAAGGMVLGGGSGATLAKLHEQEMVLPAPISRGLQEMIKQGGRGNGVNANLNFSPTIHSNTGRGRGGTGMSRAEFSQMMALHSGVMLGEARSMFRQGWRPA